MVFHGPELRVGALACGQAVHMGAGRASGLDALATPGPPAQLCPGPALLPHLRGGVQSAPPYQAPYTHLGLRY